MVNQPASSAIDIVNFIFYNILFVPKHKPLGPSPGNKLILADKFG